MDNLASPIRCTQNPTMGEEWRRGWHPERIEPKRSDDRVLVVGAGPAGLECALALGRRGYPVTLAEASRELGGRVTRESALPGLSEWGRVRDYRVALLEKLANVEVFRESRLDADDVRELGAPHVLIATGASWRRDGVGRQHRWPIDGLEKTQVFSPDDVMQDRMPAGRVVVYDDDHYYMASVLAEKLRAAGCQVVLATPDAEIASWTHHTLDHDRILARLIERGVELRTSQKISEVRKEELEMSCVYTDRRSALPCDALVLVTQREPDIALYLAPDAESGVLRSLRRVGDCLVPGIIAQAVWDGHRAAREFESDTDDDLRFKHEYMRLEPR
jgi:dimethylamine/trimethylamine dehydrogenase